MYLDNLDELYELANKLNNEEKMTEILVGLVLIAKELKRKS